MKVLFNAYPLGAEIYSLRNKTGIYRVVEQLALNLAKAAADPVNRLEVTFHTPLYPWAAHLYFEKYLRGPGTDFAARSWSLATARLEDAILGFCLRTKQDRRLRMRAFRWAITRGPSPMRERYGSLKDRMMAGADIYHSPFIKIPPSVRQHRHLRRFTTVYDLIPLTHPEYFDEGPVDTVRAVIDSFRPDDFVTCISHFTRTQLLEHAPQLTPERVFVTHLAAGGWFRREEDPARIASVCAPFGLTADTPYFLTLCTLEPRKNIELVIRAFARLRRERQIGPEHRLVLVGGGGWKTERILAALQEAQHCEDAIIRTGFVPDEHLSALYSGALAFVYPSRLEGFGLPPLEAMQCGVPVITSNTSSLPEVVGDAGLTIAPDDLDGLCAHMLRLAHDEVLRRELSIHSLARAKWFTWERFGAETMLAYHQAMAMA